MQQQQQHPHSLSSPCRRCNANARMRKKENEDWRDGLKKDDDGDCIKDEKEDEGSVLALLFLHSVDDGSDDDDKECKKEEEEEDRNGECAELPSTKGLVNSSSSVSASTCYGSNDGDGGCGNDEEEEEEMKTKTEPHFEEQKEEEDVEKNGAYVSVMLVLITCVIPIFVEDLVSRGLDESNGKEKNVFSTVSFNFLYSLLAKNIAPFAIAFWLTRVPPMLQSFRHVMTFVIAGLTVMFLIPNGHRTLLVTPNHPAQIILSFGRALYKIRKLQFIVATATAEHHKIIPTLFFGFLTMELTGLIHKGEAALESTESITETARRAPIFILNSVFSPKVLISTCATALLFCAHYCSEQKIVGVSVSVSVPVVSNGNMSQFEMETDNFLPGIPNIEMGSLEMGLKVFALGVLILRYNYDSLFSTCTPPVLEGGRSENEMWVPRWWERSDLVESAKNDLKLTLELFRDHIPHNIKTGFQKTLTT